MALRKNASLGAITNHAGLLAVKAENLRNAWDRAKRLHQGLDGGTWNPEEFHRAEHHLQEAREAARDMREIADALMHLVDRQSK